jgi:hypothetical protein
LTGKATLRDSQTGLLKLKTRRERLFILHGVFFALRMRSEAVVLAILAITLLLINVDFQLF